MQHRHLVVSAALCLGVCACHGHVKPPTGQVAAVVEGHEITVRQINAELNGNLPPDPKQLKAAQQHALQTIILRTLLADKAVHERLNKGPDFALQEQRARENLLAHLYQEQLSSSVPTPSDEEVQSYIEAHPNLFSQRKVFTVDQLRMRGPLSPDVVKALAPLKSIDAASALLSSKGVPFQRGQTQVDAIGLDPRLVDAFAKLRPDDMLIVPSGELFTLNAVQNTSTQPFTGPNATTYARGLIHQQATGEAEQRELQSLVHSAAKTIAYNPAFRPPAPLKSSESTPASPTP